MAFITPLYQYNLPDVSDSRTVPAGSYIFDVYRNGKPFNIGTVYNQKTQNVIWAIDDFQKRFIPDLKYFDESLGTEDEFDIAEYNGIDAFNTNSTINIKEEPEPKPEPPPPPPIEPEIESKPIGKEPVLEKKYQFDPPVKNEAPVQKVGDKSKKETGRIWNIFKPTLVLDEMSLPDYGSNGGQQKAEDSISMAWPFIKINDHIFSPEEINSMVIDTRGFLPTISLSVIFYSKLFVSKSMPKDGDIISVMIRNKNDILVPIRNDYVITGAPSKSIDPNSKIPNVFTFFGELFIPGLKSFLSTKSIAGTSMEALKEVASGLNIGFNSNETETNDKQIWIISGGIDGFIKDATYKSWKDENSFFDCWIDVYYNLNFVNVQKILLSPEDEIDPAAFLGNLDVEYRWGSKSDQEDAVAYPKVLSNFPSYVTSSNYITGWKPINKSSAITFEYGTSMNCSFYEHLSDLYSNSESKKYWNLEISPDYDPNKINSHILLRGRPHWDPSTGKGEQALANYSYKEIYKRSPWLGIQYTIVNSDIEPNDWTGNHHPNYMRAQVHNLMNRLEIDKLNLEIKVKGTNTNIIKGDKLPVVLIKGDPHEAQMANVPDAPKEAIDFFYTGWYYVKGYTLSWSRNRGNMSSSFAQSFILTRREWTPPEPVDPIKEIEPQNNNAI